MGRSDSLVAMDHVDTIAGDVWTGLLRGVTFVPSQEVNNFLLPRRRLRPPASGGELPIRLNLTH